MARIEPIEVDGKHYVAISSNGQEIERRGPYRSATTAATAAHQLTTLCQVLFHGVWPIETADPPAAKRRAGSRRFG